MKQEQNSTMLTILRQTSTSRTTGSLVTVSASALLLILLFSLSSQECHAFHSIPFGAGAGRTRHSSRLHVATGLPLDQQIGGSSSGGGGLSIMDDNSSSSSSSTTTETKVGVLLLNLGGPEKSDDVEGFLYNLFADPDIIRLPAPLAPLQSLIAYGISKRRAPKSRAAYNSIGGGSPILRYSNAQARLIEEALRDQHGLREVRCYVGMRYWKPYTEDALDQIRADGVDALVIVPLYPQFSISTSGSSLRILQEEFAGKRGELYRGMTHTVVPSWYDRPGYVSCMANLITKELNAYTADELAEGNQERHVLFSAHGVPKSYIDAGDPYQEQIKDCVRRITALLPTPKEGVHVHLSYQSRVGPIEWLRPYTDDVLPQLGADGVKNLVVVPISFVSEHIETLEEIDIEYRELAEENGICNWKRCPALNTDQSFVDDMAQMVVSALEEPIQTVTEACVANNCGDLELMTMDERMGINGNIGGSSSGGGGNTVRNDDAEDAERLNGRVAMMGIAGTMLAEMANGNSLVKMFGL